MSEQTEKTSALYKRLAASEEGKHLLNWMQNTIGQTRQSAFRLDAISAWGQLQHAEGIAAVISHIETMKNMEVIGKTDKHPPVKRA